jgi:hypothetical protein
LIPDVAVTVRNWAIDDIEDGAFGEESDQGARVAGLFAETHVVTIGVRDARLTSDDEVSVSECA